MKLFKLGLRFWITMTSVLSFVGGWILLVHAPKPFQSSAASSAAITPLPTLEPLPPLGSQNSNSPNQSFFNVQPVPRAQARPFFQTGGS